MSIDNTSAGLFHFANPGNYFRNLASYTSPDVVPVKVEQREYLTSPTSRPDFILGLSFGEGRCNKILAQTMRDAYVHFNRIPFLAAQEEISNLYENLFLEEMNSIPTRSPEGKYRTSRAVIRDGISRYGSVWNIALVAHPAHMERILVTASQEGLKGFPFTPKEIVWNEQGDKHGWTTSPRKWVTRELLLGRTAGSFL